MEMRSDPRLLLGRTAVVIDDATGVHLKCDFMQYPSVRGYGDFEVETFDSYYARWPQELSAVPRQVVQDWIYRHWRDFSNHWSGLAPHTWSYELKSLSSEEIRSIDHVGTWISELDAEGVEYISDTPRSRTRMAKYMLEYGTFPVPILVAQSAGHVVHPRSVREFMKEPLQLVEGHCRLACLRGMMNAKHPNLAHQHQVWVATIPRISND